VRMLLLSNGMDYEKAFNDHVNKLRI